MKPKVVLQTLLLCAVWFFSQNFNASHGNVYNNAAGDIGSKSTYKIRKIVLDAGHGGKDPGCVGASSKEKDHALAIVLKLGAMIKHDFPGIQVIYTRDKDVFIELKERAGIANRNDADLFISVHCNSISVTRVTGTETYVMGLHTAAHNLEVAKRENASIYLEENYEKNYDGYDPNSPEAHILGSLWQSAYLEQSILLAGFVQKHAKSTGHRLDRGVKQAGFLVLRETAMPSVLVETGYMTNKEEEAYLASDEGREAMARSIFEAFHDYKTQMEGGTVEAPKVASAGSTQAKGSAPPASAKPAEKKTATATPVEKPRAPAVTEPGFRILLMSWPVRLDTKSGQLALVSNVREEKTGAEYRYFVGTFATRNEAERNLAELRNLGFKTAIIEEIK